MKRLDFVDLLKGFGILFVVFGHMTVYGKAYIYSFHMPLFAFIAGFFFKEIDFYNFLFKKVKRLLVPFFFYSLLFWIIYTIIIYFNYNEYFGEQIKRLFYILAGTGQNGIISLGLANVVLWFIPYLFVTDLLLWVIYTLLKKEKERAFCVIICMTIGIVLALKKISMPYSFDTVCLLSPFFYAGTKFINFFKYHKITNIYVWILLFGILHLFLYRLNYILSDETSVDVASGITGNIILFYLSALFGIAFYSLICIKLSRIPLLNYLGKNSIVIMIVHIPIIQLYIYYLKNVFILNNILIQFLITVTISCILVYIINNKLPWSIGLTINKGFK